MKTTKMIVAAALMMGAAALSANAGVRISIGLPLPVVVAPSVIVSAPVSVVETVPPCPGTDYVWAPGYYTAGHVWVRGCWNYRPTHIVYGHDYGRYDNDRRDFDRHDHDRR